MTSYVLDRSSVLFEYREIYEHENENNVLLSPLIFMRPAMRKHLNVNKAM